MPRKRFSPYNKPLAPVKPQEYIPSSEPLFSISLEPLLLLALTDEIREILASADSIHIADVDVVLRGYDRFHTAKFQIIRRPSKSKLRTAIRNLPRRIFSVQGKLAWWKAEKAKYDAKEAKKKEAAERRQLERLQKSGMGQNHDRDYPSIRPAHHQLQVDRIEGTIGYGFELDGN